uniref:Envelope glycoprotein n=1 Tax=Soybean thrips thogotovirus 1 TaxID=2797871 RepID=A0A7T8ASE5_9ORTO|nr:envelope glycoprotein [Soybean thrips thogotovirus 1]
MSAVATMLLFTIVSLREMDGKICSDQLTKGPYKLNAPRSMKINLTREELPFVRYSLDSDIQATVAYRALWRSYCYNGGSLDSNTGCENSLKQFVPSKEEVDKWKMRGHCLVGKEAEDAWGSDSYVCLEQPKFEDNWKQNPTELVRKTQNRRFAYHTCNLSWRCGYHTSKWQTLLQFLEGSSQSKVGLGIVMNNGSLKFVEQGEVVNSEDLILVIDNVPKVSEKSINATCISSTVQGLHCIDPIDGKSFSLSSGNRGCRLRECYFYVGSTKIQKLFKKRVEKVVATSNIDIGLVWEEFIMQHEETKFNLVKVQEEVERLETTVMSLIKSIAKIDDRLIGNIIGSPSKTRFITDEHFTLSPCVGDAITDSNCHGNLIYSDGRWRKQEVGERGNCVKVSKSLDLDLWRHFSIWMPEIVSDDLFNVATDQEGWSFYAQEKNRLSKAMEVAVDSVPNSALGDILGMPFGSIQGILSGLLIGKVIVIIVIIIMFILSVKVIRLATKFG